VKNTLAGELAIAFEGCCLKVFTGTKRLDMPPLLEDRELEADTTQVLEKRGTRTAMVSSWFVAQ